MVQISEKIRAAVGLDDDAVDLTEDTTKAPEPAEVES